MKISTAAPGTVLLDKDGVSWERLDKGAIVTTGGGSKLAWEESSLYLWGDAQNGPFTLAYAHNDAKQLQEIKAVMSAIKTVYEGYKKGYINADVAMYRISRVTGWGETKDALGPTE